MPGDEGVLVAVVVEPIVAGEGEKGAEPGAEGEEYLCGSCDPYLCIGQQVNAKHRRAGGSDGRSGNNKHILLGLMYSIYV